MGNDFFHMGTGQRMGDYYWAQRAMKKIIFFLIVIIVFIPTAQAFIPLLIATGSRYAGTIALEAAIKRGVASMTIEAAERQVIANATRAALNQSVARLATGSANPTKFQLASGAMSWAYLGEALLNIGDEIFGVDETGEAGVSSGTTADNGRKFFVGAGSGGTAPYYSGDHPESLIMSAYRYQIKNGLLQCSSSAGCTYSPSITVVSSAQLSDGGTSYVIRYQSSYQSTSGTTVTRDGTRSYTIKSNPSYSPYIPPSTPDITTTQEDRVKNTPLDAQKMADVANALLLDAASQPDYAGIPYSSANPAFKSSDFSDAAASVGRPNPSQAEWTTPWEDLKPDTGTGTGTETQPGDGGNNGGNDSGSTETATPPSLDNPPDGKTILAPITGLFTEWDSFSIGSRAATCPTAEFDVWDEHFIIDTHCVLIEQNRDLIKIIFLIVWSFAAFRRVMSA